MWWRRWPCACLQRAPGAGDLSAHTVRAHAAQASCMVPQSIAHSQWCWRAAYSQLGMCPAACSCMHAMGCVSTGFSNPPCMTRAGKLGRFLFPGILLTLAASFYLGVPRMGSASSKDTMGKASAHWQPSTSASGPKKLSKSGYDVSGHAARGVQESPACSCTNFATCRSHL